MTAADPLVTSGAASPQVHARIEFQLLEGAELALSAFNRLEVEGRTVKVKLSIF